MKSKLLLVAALCAITFTANAQTEKGKSLIGGTISFFTFNGEQGDSKTNQNDFTIGPKFGYFFGRNFAIGLDAKYRYAKTSSDYTRLMAENGEYVLQTISQYSKDRSIGIGTFARYYVDITEKFKFFGQFNANIGFGKGEQSVTYPSIIKSTNYNASISPSIAFFPTKKLAVELGFGLISYFHTKNKYEEQNHDDYKTSGFGFGFDTFNPNIGVNFHF